MTAWSPFSSHSCRGTTAGGPGACDCRQIGYIRSLSGDNRLPGRQAASMQSQELP